MTLSLGKRCVSLIAGGLIASGLIAFASIGMSAARAAEFGDLLRQPQASQAPNAMSIAAVVNEDVITVYDVQARVSLIIATSGLDNTADMQRRLIPQALDKLIEERLQMQEAKRLKITITETDVRQAMENIEQRNGMPPGSFRAMLNEKHLDPASLYAQLEAQLAWLKVVRQSIERDISIQPQEVNAVLTRMKANQGKTEHLVSEIYLPFNEGAPEATMRELAQRLVQQVRGGTPFPALAQQFSQSPTAAVGGDLGWVIQGDFEPEVDAALARMEPNEVSDPIRTVSGYHVVQLRGRRSAGAPDPRMAVVTLSQVYLPTEGAHALSADKLAQTTDAIRTQVSTCEQMDKWAKDVASPGSGRVPEMYIGGLPEKVRDAVTDMKPGHVSKPIDVAGAVLFAAVCTRKDDTGLPSVEQIRSQLENEKLENAARQKLRDLRRQALVDPRL